MRHDWSNSLTFQSHGRLIITFIFSHLVATVFKRRDTQGCMRQMRQDPSLNQLMHPEFWNYNLKCTIMFEADSKKYVKMRPWYAISAT